jgi:hypothetical protein
VAVVTRTLVHGQREYTDLLADLTATPGLVEAMWDEAESRFGELDEPGTLWTVAFTRDGRAGAWCAATVLGGGQIKCHNNYEPGPYRGQGLYEAAHRARHRDVLVKLGLPAVTYLFRDPIPLHEKHGWRTTGVHAPGELAGHHWWELTWKP